MRLTKYGHACVRIDGENGAVVIDPGTWSGPVPFDEVRAVLITHEHQDHLDAAMLTAACRADPGLRIHAPAEVADALTDIAESVVPVAVGDVFTAAGMSVSAVGGSHAEIYGGLPRCANLGYVVDTPAGRLYHPGDALHVPDQLVDTLLVPVSAPWLKLAEAIEFVRAVAPRRAFPIHDILFTDTGNVLVDNWIARESRTEYRRLAVGESIELSS